MEWFEKEAAFEKRWNRGTYARNLWNYIPDELAVAIEECTVDADGYWIYLREGWHVDSERTIHAYTILDIREDINRIEREGRNRR